MALLYQKRVLPFFQNSAKICSSLSQYGMDFWYLWSRDCTCLVKINRNRPTNFTSYQYRPNKGDFKTQASIECLFLTLWNTYKQGGRHLFSLSQRGKRHYILFLHWLKNRLSWYFWTCIYNVHHSVYQYTRWCDESFYSRRNWEIVQDQFDDGDHTKPCSNPVTPCPTKAACHSF